MNNVFVRRQPKVTRIEPSPTGTAKVLKFDRRNGVIVVEKLGPRTKPKSVVAMVRDLLRFWRPNGTATRSHRGRSGLR